MIGTSAPASAGRPYNSTDHLTDGNRSRVLR
jgi:hypothetical protein